MIVGEDPKAASEQNYGRLHELVENLQTQVRALRAERDALMAENTHLWDLVRDGSLE